jgi:hypothetical protein
VDGEGGKRYYEIGALVFSPNSKRVAYTARMDSKVFVVVDAKEGKRYEQIFANWSGGIVFDSPNKIHYLAAESRIVYLVKVKLR